MAERNRWLIVVLYGAAMAWVESASVVYLRMLVDRVNPYQPNPLPRHDLLGTVELIREMATLIMLRITRVFAKRNGRWQIVAGHESRISSSK